ncbi:MAG: hypothetical protein K2W95_22590 [Candidatus Obscuribacterales bacterium]|nr:hypothetical protein [Candidatus Obscuribacterales bacterium]
MKKSFATALVLSTLVSVVTTTIPAYGCAFSVDPCFTYTNHPDFPLKKFAAGDLSILQPGYARSYLIVAYRYLAGKPLTKPEQDAMVSLWDNRLGQSDYSCNTDTSGWLKLRATIPGTTKIDNLYTERAINPDEAWQTYCNCQPSAFKTAGETLNALVGKYGATSPEVKEWLSAQDDVFSNCGEAPYSDKKVALKIPAPLPATADVTLQKQRAYQIAAANFYAQNFETAVKQFDSIAADSASPWKNIAPYLAVRALIRQASLTKAGGDTQLKEAHGRIAKLLADNAYQSIHDDLKPLDDYIQARIAPVEHLASLTQVAFTEQSAAELTKTLDRILGEGLSESLSDTKYDTLPHDVKQPEMIDWIMTYQTDGDTSTAHAVEQWKKTGSLPWLVAAATAINGKHADAAAIITAASKENSSTAKWTLFSEVNRLNIERGKLDEARTAIDRVLAAPAPDLLISAQNELKTMRLPLSRNLEEFLRFGIQNPAAILDSGLIDGVPDDVTEREAGKIERTNPLLTPEAGQVLISGMPLRVLKQVADTKTLPKDIRNNVAWTSWVRAVLIGDDSMARSLATTMLPFNKSRAPLVNAYLAAKTPADRSFAATYIMLKYSSARPEVTTGIQQDDNYGDSSGWWWSSGITTNSDVEKIDPLFLTASDKSQAKSEIAKLSKVETAPTYLTKSVINRLKTNPGDPRLAEALHLAVKCTRYGATDDTTKGLSKQAFQLLHSRFKNSSWAKDTPYWY